MHERRVFEGSTRGKKPENFFRERHPITPDNFVADGNSREAHEFERQWVEAQHEGELTAIIGCSDARTTYNPKNAVGIRTIAAAVPQELYGNVLSRDFGTRNVVVMAHHDGRKIEPGSRPPGCGGRDEKAKLRSDQKSHSEGALRYVREHVAHEDPVIGAWYSALEISEKSQLPVLAISQDHITGNIIPIGAVQPTDHGGIKIYSEISLRQILHGQYDPQAIYASGIPQLPPEKIPQEFHPFLRRHARYLEDLKERNPQFESTQAIQNPDTVLLTTVVRASRGRLPELSGRSSNRIFAITIARQGTTGEVDEQSIVKAADELEYPLLNGLESKGDLKKPFSSLYKNGTVIVETRNIARSRHVVTDLLEKPWFKKWAEVEGNKIIVAQTKRGIVDHAEYFSHPHLID